MPPRHAPVSLDRADRDRVRAYRDAIIAWYRGHARDLPWRRDPTPYRVWVSEVMLQQTRVETVLRYYDRFLRRFPDLEALAAAPEEDVLEAWSGLGYYRRARALRRGAQEVVERFGGVFPRDDAGARSVPGVGRYTAGAVRSIAYGERAPIVDGNVARVLARLFGVEGEPTRGEASRRLWALAEAVVKEGDPAEVNQAQMEFGARLCTPSSPSCGECPLRRRCIARRDGRVDQLPTRPARREPLDVTRNVLLVRRGPRVLLRRRPADELLPGLWDLPGAFAGDDASKARRPEELAAELPLALESVSEVGSVRHAVTYRRITLRIHVAEAAAGAPAEPGTDRGGAELAWRVPAEADAKALSSPARRILRRFAGLLDTSEERPVSCDARSTP